MGSIAQAGEPVVSDAGTELSVDELKLVVQSWSPEMRAAAQDDNAALYTLLNQAVAVKKMAAQAESMTPEKDGETYWRKEMVKQRALQMFYFREFTNNLEIPDMSALAEERYKTQKERYAWVPEKRQSSHILLSCAPPQCRYETRTDEMKAIQAELETKPFEEVARVKSEDRVTARNGGALSLSVSIAQEGIDKNYRQGLFDLEEVGQVSPMIPSSFGIHLIRLDAIEEGYFKPYNQVRDSIIEELTNEYRKVKVAEFNETYRFTDDTKIDDQAVREILEQTAQ
jgi:hypothetical protein